MKMLRVLRGILGTAVAWSVAWIPLTVATWSVAALLGSHVPPARYWGAMLASAAIRGFICGAAFASVLAIVGRRRSFSTLRFRHMALWGAVGGLVAPIISLSALALGSVALPPLAIGLSLGFSSVVGALSAVSTLYVARRAPGLPAAEYAVLDAPASETA